VRILFALILCIASISSNPWGFYAHKEINYLACFTLPPEMFGFYKTNIGYIQEFSVRADQRRYAVDDEAPRHYIDLDHYETLAPIDTMPMQWDSAVAKYSYIADAHVPLHTTENYNGQLTNQHGIHGLWESRLPEIFATTYDFYTGKAVYLRVPLSTIWQTVAESFAAKDSVLAMERELTLRMPNTKYSFESKGATTVKVYSREFSSAYHSALNQMVERRMKKAIFMVGCFWYTAWVDAGQPDLEFTVNQRIDLQPQLDSLAKLMQGETIKGRMETH
jgi:hypothetical protein